MKNYDAIVIGGGHNGLTCAAYLAKAGKKALVLERRHVLGGAAVTEEVFPGFKFTVCSYVVSLLRPEIIRELDLPRFGLHILPLDSAFAPMEDGNYLAMYADSASTRDELKRHSFRDADAYPEFSKVMYDMAFGVKPILGMTPPNLANPGLRGLQTLAGFGKHLQGRGKSWFHDFTKIMTMSAVDFLDEWFETDIVKALFSLNGIIGTMLGPRSPGTAYVLLHHYMGELDGAFTAWGWQRGGTGMVSESIAGAACHFGAEIRCNAPVTEVIVKNGGALGVALESGEEIYAPIIVSGADPYVTFRKLVDEKDLPSDLVQAIDNFKFRGSSGKVNLALDTLPKFTAMRDPSLLRGMMEICPSVDYLERAYDDAKYGSAPQSRGVAPQSRGVAPQSRGVAPQSRGFSQRPYMDILVPSTIDPTMAPPGKHMMSIFVQYASYDMPEHGDRDRERQEFGDAVINTLGEFVPNIKDIILHQQVLTPWDIEQKIGMTEGNIFQGELTLDQLFFLRPAPGWADYRTPIRGYYQCGSGTHPGGGITGGPGRLAALEILRR
jgi:phytoene dehydrogenase-like protein